MWMFSDAARLELSRSHTVVSRVDVLHAGKPVYQLAVTTGRVSVDANRPVRRNMAAALVDPTGDLTTGDARDMLNAYDCEIAVWRGVRVNGVDELAPQGVFGLTGKAVADGNGGLSISIEGQDRTMGFQGPMTGALAIAAGTPIEEAIERLLATRNHGATVDALNTGFVSGPLLYSPDIDVWREASELAASVGAVLYHDRTGRCVLALQGPASQTPQRVWEEGDGLLLSVDRKEDSDTISNVVTVQSASGLISVTVEDTNPESPTYTKGRYGPRPAKPVINQHIGSLEQAQQAASARLAYELGRSETTSITVVPDPAIDVQEVVTVHRPRAGLDRRDLVVASLDIPLGPTEAMTVGCRKSIITADGRFLPAEAA